MIVDNDQQVQVIDGRLDALEGMPISDDRSAGDAFTHLVVTVNRINQRPDADRSEAGWGQAFSATVGGAVSVTVDFGPE